MSKHRAATLAVRQGIESDTQYGAVVPPIYLSTNYSFDGHKNPREFDYSRSGNPTRCVLGEAIAKLEHGATGVVTCTGMAAITLVTSLLGPDDLLIVPHDCYGGSYRLFTNLANKGQFKLLVIDQTDEQALSDAIAQKPKMVWLETPSNPLLRVVDIKAIAEQSHKVDALVVVDNTFLSPILQQPLELGADIVMHSTTKYINGHSDVVGGAVVAKDPELGELLHWWSNTLGLTGSAFDSYLTLRGIRTLAVRIREHQKNAEQVIDVLQASNLVEKVYYPGLKDHPGHDIAAKQQQGFGAMLSFELKGGEAEVVAFLNALSIFSVAESLGGVESLVAVPATMTHRAMAPAARYEAGIKDTLLRLSVGIEDAEDLVADIEVGLAAVAAL
ncbi:MULTISPECIES: cystathionine gamma-synthase [unclassified Shewanella]|uniref:cystathionine gamma-synthase n=1 Tax=unclassified Shewanella TaxID=196818 RepID=UPI000C84DD95|nr:MULTISPECIES: cystathionine gamma-synthase [unclassified Shewanella]MDO6638540.1 cystathionine gamma-synthase [Shewanella sp. 5_MG-2023]MDO6679561.1 cystathionine gamma-synthase [Shewanella sp. 4_MG-2023]MDO6774643.1 cystathionine gamma-synthase [Shewanella sp. 3_MG-2023]PMG32294.1 O-succinylhomoserine (thiol)-lyase [Shewanella sp. 10N.286.52.C2]PMH88259.1 O-succinylhomoserine (thiol)-lyase [Shewanella sp. 10N.286.48.B5]